MAEKVLAPAKMECLTMRDGPTPVQIGKSGHPLMFQERRDALCPETGPTTSVFTVQSQEQIDHLMDCGNFRKFDPKVPPPALNPVLDLGNFHIEKFVYGKDEGYMCVQKAPRKYAGRDMVWKDTTKDLLAFQNEISAYDWLVEEVKANMVDGVQKEIVHEISPEMKAAQEEIEQLKAMLAVKNEGEKTKSNKDNEKAGGKALDKMNLT